MSIDIHVFDEANTRIMPQRIAALVKAADDGMVLLVGGIGGFHMSGRHNEFRRRAGLPVSMLVLHHHQCAGAQITTAYAG